VENWKTTGKKQKQINASGYNLMLFFRIAYTYIINIRSETFFFIYFYCRRPFCTALQLLREDASCTYRYVASNQTHFASVTMRL